MIECTDLHKSFGNSKVLKGVNFEIGDGQIFGLLGPSGAGKTTIIKILTNQLDFDEGKIRIMGKNVTQLDGNDMKNIGIMMDNFGVYERLSCADNLKIFADIYGVSHSKVSEILEYVGLADAEKKAACNLSKGMEARLRLARVFLHSPEVIFLDEPTSGLDPKTMKSIHKLILEKKRQGCTIFLTTHNMEEATKLCDRVALINDGTIIENGRPSDICLKYNKNRVIKIRLTSGESLVIPHSSEASEQVFKLMKDNIIDSIHSSEPSLENVFLELTGKRLKEEE